jgi:hypothetical protein
VTRREALSSIGRGSFFVLFFSVACYGKISKCVSDKEAPGGVGGGDRGA